MKFSPTRYKALCQDYNANWAALDGTLYDLCKRFPTHETRGAINAKLWVIGRTYQTGIERKIASDGFQGSSMEQLAAHLWKERSHVDEAMHPLNALCHPLTPQNLPTILHAHGKMLRIVQGPLRKGQTPRSFVSKYLHFHCPAVPVYDSFAQAQLRTLYPWKPSYAVSSPGPLADPEYTKFVFRFWQLYSDALQSGAQVVVKHLDNYLLALAREAR